MARMKAGENAFFTDAKIVGDIEPALRVRDSVAKAEAKPFMDKYTVKMSRAGAAVFDGDKVIATIGRLADLVVHKDYRGHGIATALVVAWRKAFPDEMVSHRPVRTKGGDAVYKKAFHELYPDKPMEEPKKEDKKKKVAWRRKA